MSAFRKRKECQHKQNNGKETQDRKLNVQTFKKNNDR